MESFFGWMCRVHALTGCVAFKSTTDLQEWVRRLVGRFWLDVGCKRGFHGHQRRASFGCDVAGVVVGCMYRRDRRQRAARPGRQTRRLKACGGEEGRTRSQERGVEEAIVDRAADTVRQMDARAGLTASWNNWLCFSFFLYLQPAVLHTTRRWGLEPRHRHRPQRQRWLYFVIENSSSCAVACLGESGIFFSFLMPARISTLRRPLFSCNIRLQVTNLRTWIHYNHRCAPAGDPDTITTATTYPGGEAVAPDEQAAAAAAAEVSQSRSRQQHRRRPGRKQADLRRQESKASGGGEGWVDGGPAESGAAPRFWGREPIPGAGTDGGEVNNNNNNSPGSPSGVGGRDPAAAGYASSSTTKDPAPRERGDAPRGAGSGAGDGKDDGLLIGNVHFGFCEFYQTLVAEGLADRVMHLARHHPTYTIFVTGHSLGGAAAAVCAADLVQRLGVLSERVVLYTLGEPRAGDGIFADGINEHVVSAMHTSLLRLGWRFFLSLSGVFFSRSVGLCVSVGSLNVLHTPLLCGR